MGQVYRRADSRAWWCWYYDADGKRVRVTTRKTDKRAAEIWLAAREVQSAREFAGAPRIEALTLGEAVPLFTAEHKPPIYSRQWHRTILYWWNGRLLPDLGEDTPVSEVSKERVTALRNAWLLEVTPASVNRLTSIGSGFYRWAIERGYALTNPFQGRGKLAEAVVPPPEVSDEGLGAFLAACDDDMRDRAIVALDTTIRRGELESLRWEQVRRHPPAIVVANTYRHRTKTGKTRTVPLSRRAWDAIRAQEGKRDDGYVFGPMAVTAFRERMVAAQGAAGVPRFRWHDLRHYGLTRLGRYLTPRQIQDVAGWGSLAMLPRYVHPEAEGIRAAIARLERATSVTEGRRKQANRGQR